jgi:hypothetical protein
MLIGVFFAVAKGCAVSWQRNSGLLMMATLFR